MIACPKRKAVFLDRDGVLIKDIHLLTQREDIKVLDGVPEALVKLKNSGFQLIVVTNQTVISRGLATEAEVHSINHHIEELLKNRNAPSLDGIYICPHHPNATLANYRVACECRKPRAGLFLQAAREHNLDLSASFAVGDRITDIIAGAKCGCRTILIQTGQHTAVPIQTMEPIDPTIKPDFTCADLAAAANWILEQGK